jgi:hypothetical protein
MPRKIFTGEGEFNTDDMEWGKFESGDEERTDSLLPS